MKVAILANGEYAEYKFCKSLVEYDYIICADNGLYHADKLNITPNLLIGDFDSVDKTLLEKYNFVETKRLQPIKDETDTECAVDYAVSIGATEITIFAGIGTRFDHSFANVQLLLKILNLGVKGNIINTHNNIYLIDNSIEIKGRENTLVSLLPLSKKVTGVSTEGLFYGLDNGEFEMGKPYGVSNVVIQKYAKISIKQGLLLIILAND
ncbi:MAG: thiamine diphosphokinase [Epulopiscium sp. Nuni2H_MBin003]|nr:MAG: thiamine diphosphokinase [Epulopiscium sp. Nuni2H_MBin003]